jgi:hypothetical protein
LTLLKCIVACLALANVGYFLWAHGIGRPPEPAPVAPATTLQLASESADGARAVSADASAAEPRAAAEPRGAAGPHAAAEPGADAARTDAAGADASSADGSSGALLASVKRCISVGPFRDVSEAAHAATTLRGGGYDPRQRVADGDVWAGVWVYLPLPASRAAEDQMLAKLKSGGIDDALEMPGPNDGSVISLGLYSEPKRAESRVAQVQALGFNPAIADRKRTGNVYWIDIDLKPTDGLLNPADLQGESGRIVRLEVKSCPSPSGTPP